MEAAKKLQLYLIGLQREDLPSKPDMLRKVSYGNTDDIFQKETKIKEKIKFWWCEFLEDYQCSPLIFDIANGDLWIPINMNRRLQKWKKSWKRKLSY